MKIIDGTAGRIAVKHLPEIARVAMGDGSVLYNPEELDYDDALRVLKAAYKGAPLV